MCSEGFVEEGTVPVGGELKFSPGASDLKEGGREDTKAWYDPVFVCLAGFYLVSSADFSFGSH